MPGPTSSDFDALVELTPPGNRVPERAYALVKRTFAVTDGVLTPLPAVPLAHDIRHRPNGERPDKLPLGSDFWIYKRLTDVVVVGSAHAARPTTQMEVSCSVGNRTKRIAVFGRRHIEWKGAAARIGLTEPFTSMPIDNAHAYGGVDTRVPYPPIRSVMDALRVAANHPGTYPRNDLGKGYYVVPERFDGIELPNLENPDDLLTDERLIVGEPAHWGRQPLPWTFDWQAHWTFPRCAFLGLPPRYGVPASELTEVRMGILSPGYESIIADEPAATEEARVVRELFRDRFYQEASAGMQLGPLGEGVPIRVRGMRPDGDELAFSLPAPPRMEILFETRPEPVQAQMSNLVIEPASATVSVTYFACTTGLPRKLISGTHQHIPLSLRVDGARTVNWDPTPPRHPSAS